MIPGCYDYDTQKNITVGIIAGE